MAQNHYQNSLIRMLTIDKRKGFLPAHSAHPCMCCLDKNTYLPANNLFSCQYSTSLLKRFDNDFVPCCLQKKVFKTLWCDEWTEWWKRDNCYAIYVLQGTFYWETTLDGDCVFHVKCNFDEKFLYLLCEEFSNKQIASK